ncbi:MAG: DMT family transporter [Pseudomonadota bacterium]|nr:DMT family transporter [Pseudomonadota bacterium]
MRILGHPYVLLALTTLFWGGNAVAGKFAIGHVSPMILVFLRWTLACLIMAPFAIGHVRRDWPTIRQNLPLLFCLGACGFTVFNATFYTAVTYTSAINVMIEQSAMPLVVFVASFLLFRTQVAPLQIVGFLITMIGVALTASHGEPKTLLSLDLNRGDAWMLFAVLVYGLYTAALRLKPAISWQSSIFCLSVAALITAVPFALVESARGAAQWPDLQGLVVVLYTAVFASLLSQTFYIRGVELIGGNRANLFINLVPIFGSILAVALLGETLHGYQVLALAFVIGGILLAEQSARRKIAMAGERRDE